MFIKYLLGFFSIIALWAINSGVLAECQESFPVEGVVSVESCEPESVKCIFGAKSPKNCQRL